MVQSTWPTTGSISAGNFLNQLSKLNSFSGFIIPNYLENLEVISATPANGAVYVKSGAAMFGSSTWLGDILYTNDSSVTVTITNAANNRIDRIVLRSNRITKIIGAEAATPAMPALISGDFPIAWIFIPAGYNAATTIIQPYYIHDERPFAHIGNEPVEFTNSMNLMHNFEFMAYARGGATTTPPELWKTTGALTDCGPYTPIIGTRNFPNRSRGITITHQAGTGIFTSIPLPVNGINTYTLRFLWQKIDATHTTITIASRVFGGAASSPKVINLSRINSDPYQDEYIRYTITDTADAIDITISAGGATVTRISPIIITQGLCTTLNFPRKHEIIPMDRVLQDASWTATAKSSGATTINLNASFGSGNIRRGTVAIIARIEANDSGSAATAANSLVLGAATGTYSTNINGSVSVGLIPNDFKRTSVVYVPVDYNVSTSPILATVAASGAGTLDATIEIIGVIT